MSKNNKITVEETIQRIRSFVERKKEKREEISNVQITLPRYTAPNLWHEPFSREEKISFKVKEEYVLNDFLIFEGTKFIKSIFKGILRREPAEEEVKYLLQELQTKNKLSTISKIRYSKEGKEKNIFVKNLSRYYKKEKIFRYRIIGPAIKLFFIVKNLPQKLAALDRFESFTRLKFQEIQNDIDNKVRVIGNRVQTTTSTQEEFINKSISKIESYFHELEKYVNELEEKKASKESVRRFQEGINQLDFNISILKERVAIRYDQIASNLQEQDNNITGINQDVKTINQDVKSTQRYVRNVVKNKEVLNELLKEARERLPSVFTAKETMELINQQQDSLDPFYAGFEDKFRGTREEIKTKLEIYLKDIKILHNKINKKNVGKGNKKSIKIIDLGCGRGEWLEILQYQGYHAIGIDHNHSFIDECQKLKLKVQEEDIFSFLEQQDKNSFDVMTAFHIIEHLPLQKQVKLLDEVLRVLKPGGMMILETPNPENLLIGSCYFYMDPTHKNPLVPESLHFLVQERGFQETMVRRLHKYSDFHEVSESELEDEFRQRWFYSEMDFAVIAYKEKKEGREE